MLGPRRPGQTRVATVRAYSGVPLYLAGAVHIDPPDIAGLLADISVFTLSAAGCSVVERVAVEATLVQELDGNESLAGQRTLTFVLGHALERLQDVRPHCTLRAVLGVSQDTSEVLLGADSPTDEGLATVVVGVLAPIDRSDLDLISLPPLLDEFVGEGLRCLIGGQIGRRACDGDVAIFHRLEPLLQGSDVRLDVLHLVLQGADATLKFGNLLVLLDVLVGDRLDGGRELGHLVGEGGVGGLNLPLNLGLHLVREAGRLGGRHGEGRRRDGRQHHAEEHGECDHHGRDDCGDAKPPQGVSPDNDAHPNRDNNREDDP